MLIADVLICPHPSYNRNHRFVYAYLMRLSYRQSFNFFHCIKYIFSVKAKLGDRAIGVVSISHRYGHSAHRFLCTEGLNKLWLTSLLRERVRRNSFHWYSARNRLTVFREARHSHRGRILEIEDLRTGVQPFHGSIDGSGPEF